MGVRNLQSVLRKMLLAAACSGHMDAIALLISRQEFSVDCLDDALVVLARCRKASAVNIILVLLPEKQRNKSIKKMHAACGDVALIKLLLSYIQDRGDRNALIQDAIQAAWGRDRNGEVIDWLLTWSFDNDVPVFLYGLIEREESWTQMIDEKSDSPIGQMMKNHMAACELFNLIEEKIKQTAKIDWLLSAELSDICKGWHVEISLKVLGKLVKRGNHEAVVELIEGIVDNNERSKILAPLLAALVAAGGQGILKIIQQYPPDEQIRICSSALEYALDSDCDHVVASFLDWTFLNNIPIDLARHASRCNTIVRRHGQVRVLQQMLMGRTGQPARIDPSLPDRGAVLPHVLRFLAADTSVSLFPKNG